MTGNLTRTFNDVKERLDAGDGINSQTLAATADGTLAYVNPETDILFVTSAAADNWFYMPAAVSGKRMTINVAATCEVRSAVAADKMNNVVIGATNEAPLIAGATYDARYVAGNWLITGVDAEGVAVAAVVPNAV